MKRVLALLMICSSLPILAADTKSTADDLNRWVGGKWVGNAHFFDTEYSKSGTGGGVSTCAWSPNHIFVVCDQEAKENGAVARSLSVYSFDPKNGTYHFYGLSPEGGRPRAGDVSISPDGAHWEYLTKTEIKGKPVSFRTVNQFLGNDKVEWWSEYSTDDGQHWTKTGEGSEKREK